MAGILALLAFALAVIFHGFGFSPDAWLGWEGMFLLGVLLLAPHLVTGGGLPLVIRRQGQ